MLLSSAIIAGHDHNSMSFQNNFGNSTIINQHVCCEDPTAANKTLTLICKMCNNVCNSGTMDTSTMEYFFSEMCRCYPISQCLYNGYETNSKLSIMYQLWQQLAPMLAVFTFWSILTSVVCLLTVSVLYNFHTENRVRSYHVKHLTLSLAMYMYLTLLNITDEFHGLPALLNFKPTGLLRLLIVLSFNGCQLLHNIEIYFFIKCRGDNTIMFSSCKGLHKCIIYNQWSWIFIIILNISLILLNINFEDSMVLVTNILGISNVIIIRSICLVLGFLNMCVSICTIISTLSIPTTGDRLLKNKVLIRELMFKISTSMWIIEVTCLILDTTVKSNFFITQILQFIKSFHGALITYALLYRPVLKNVFIKIRQIYIRWKESTNVASTNNQDLDLELDVISV